VLRRPERASDDVLSLMPTMMEQAGYDNVTEVERFSMFMGDIALIEGEKR
jgi:hypothetical protein